MIDKDRKSRRKSCARQHLARNVKLLRIMHGWSQETLAALCKCHRTYIGAIERDERNISIDNIEKIAAVFGITASDLLNENRDIDVLQMLKNWRIEEPQSVYPSPPTNQAKIDSVPVTVQRS